MNKHLLLPIIHYSPLELHGSLWGSKEEKENAMLFKDKFTLTQSTQYDAGFTAADRPPSWTGRLPNAAIALNVGLTQEQCV